MILGKQTPQLIFSHNRGSYSQLVKNAFPLCARPELKSIDVLEADLEAVFYIQSGETPRYDKFGHQTNLRTVPNSDVRELAELRLKDICENDSDARIRRKAGEALGYGSIRILAGEFFRGLLDKDDEDRDATA